MCASSAREQDEWTSHLGAFVENDQFAETNVQHRKTADKLYLAPSDMVSTGHVAQQEPGRRPRASTLGTTSKPNLVIIKNTSDLPEKLENSERRSALQRSQSVVNYASTTTILSPNRSERVRIEEAMVNVWSKELLPYPGMRVSLERSLRRSASLMMRKLSKKSITGTFTMRSQSTTSSKKKVQSPSWEFRNTDTNLLPRREESTSSQEPHDASSHKPSRRKSLRAVVARGKHAKHKDTRTGEEVGCDSCGTDDVQAESRWRPSNLLHSVSVDGLRSILAH